MTPERSLAQARVTRAKAELASAIAALHTIEEAELDAHLLKLFAEAQATGDLSRLPSCEYVPDDPSAPLCSRIATRSGGCEAFYVCDEHQCRHTCPELPWASLVRTHDAKSTPSP
jgi:hypothetical protein